jgi:hypothetical protein
MSGVGGYKDITSELAWGGGSKVMKLKKQYKQIWKSISLEC